MAYVYAVWTEQGDYENWSRDLRGVFATRALAEEHRAKLVQGDKYEVADVEEIGILEQPAMQAFHHRLAAHITVDGAEDPGLGFHRDFDSWGVWTHECPPVEGRIELWSNRSDDLYVEVTGYDRAAVEAEYSRLLTEARERMKVAAMRER